MFTPATRLRMLIGSDVGSMRRADELLATVAGFIDRNAELIAEQAGVESVRDVQRVAAALVVEETRRFEADELAEVNRRAYEAGQLLSAAIRTFGSEIHVDPCPCRICVTVERVSGPRCFGCETGDHGRFHDQGTPV